MSKAKLLILSISISFISFLKAQQKDSTVTQNWLLLMQDPNANFYEVQKLFNDYWINRTDYKGNGYNVFKRWEYINSNRVLSNGKLQSSEHVVNEFQKYMLINKLSNSNTKRSSSGTWSLLGPSNYFINNTGQPTGMGRTSMIAFHPTDANTLYVGTPSGGIWKSTNNGGAWTNISGNLPMLGVSSILIDPNNADTIIVGTGDRDGGNAPGIGVYRTVDGGVTWVKYSNGMGNVTVGCLLRHPNNKNILIASTSSGIFRSSNGGKTWSLRLGGNYKDLKFNPFNPNQVYATSFQSTATFVRSTDNGQTWTQITNGVPNAGSRIVIGVSADNPARVYLVQSASSTNIFGALLSSNDSGVSFTTMSTSPNIFGYECNGSDNNTQATYDLCIAVDPTDADIIHVGSINNWKSTDGGTTWAISSHWVGLGFSGSSCAPSVHADQHEFTWSPHNGNLYLANDGGVYYTSNGGTSWVEITNNLAIGQFYKLGQSATNVNIVLGGLQDNGCGATSNNGTSFYTTSGGDGMETLIDYSNTNYCFNTYHSGIMRRSSSGPLGSYSTIAGDGINGINESGDWVAPYFLHKSTPTTMFMGFKNVWRSTNIRATPSSNIVWETISTGETNNCKVLEQSPVNHNIIYVVRNNSLKRTSNANAPASSVSWTSCNLPGGFTPTDIKADYLDSNTVYASANYFVYKSTDKGITWTNISGNLPSLFNNCLVLDKNNAGGIYVGNQTSVWYKNNTISDWILFSTGLPPADVRELEIYYDDVTPSNSRIRAATYGNGIWSSDLAEIAVINPLSFESQPTSTSQIDLSWVKNLAGNDVVVAVSSTGIFGAPTDGVSYTSGNSIPGGGTVIYSGSGTYYSHSGLTANTKYFYKIWSVDGTPKYSAGLPKIDATTFGFNWTAGAGTSNWFTPGNWGNNKIPDALDNVVISSSASFQPQINANGAVCGNIIIESGASLTMNSVTAYTLTVSGDFINNGTFNRGIGTVNFNSPSNQVINGSSTTDFYFLSVDKSTVNSVLEVKSIITLNNPTGNSLILNSGTFKLSSASTLLVFRNSTTLTSNTRLWNNGGTISTNNSVSINPGILQNTDGTMNIGNASGHSIIYLNGGQLIIEGGIVIVAGRFCPNSGASNGVYSQSAGKLVVNTLGSTSTTRGMFEINPNAQFYFTGGTIEFQRNSTNTSQDVMILPSISSVTGGLLKFGNTSITTRLRYRLRSTIDLPNLEIDGTFAHNLMLQTNAININGNLIIGNGDTLTTNNLNIQVKGNITNDGFINSGNSLLTINGTSSQSINGSSLSKIKKLTLNNPSGLFLSGSGNLTIDSLLLFTNGSITTNSNLVVISDNGLVNGANNSSFINGNCRKIGDDAFTFPIGKNGVYAPISISAPSDNTHHFTASYFDNTPHPIYDTTLKQSPVATLSFSEYWILDRTNGNSNVSVTLSWLNTRSGTIDNVNDLLVARWDGTKWVSEGNNSTTGNTTAGTITSNSVSNFSPFTLSNLSLTPLNIDNLNFYLTSSKNKVIVNWSDENLNNFKAYYTIQRSGDGNVWTNLNNQPCLNSNELSHYLFVDEYPLNGLSYYRILVTYTNGNKVFTQAKTIYFNHSNSVNIFPNPVQNVLNLSNISNVSKIKIISLDGKYKMEVNAINNQIDVSNINSGVYYLIITDTDNNTITKMFFKN